MALDDWSQTAGSNTTVGGVSIAEGMTPGNVNNAIRGLMSEVAVYRDVLKGGVTSAGTADAQTITTGMSVAAYSSMPLIAFEAGAALTNTTTTTIAVDGLTAKTVKRPDGSNLSAGDITAGGIYLLAHEAGADVLILLNPTPPSGTGFVDTANSPGANEVARFTDANTIEGRTAAEFKADLDLEIGTDLQAFDADTLKADTADVLTAGFATTTFDAGTKSSGTFTPDEANGNHQRAVNGGAHTLAPPTNNCSIVLHYTNDGSAGAITTSGFTAVDGDSFTTTDTHEFICYITKIHDVSHLSVKALQ